MTTCPEVQRRLGRYLAMELSEGEEGDLRAHLRTCSRCRAVAEEREPSLIFAGAFDRTEPELEDQTFVDGVMAAVHQRRLEARIKLRRRRWVAAAAVAGGVLLAGFVTLRQGRVEGPALALRTAGRPAAQALAATVEVEGENVRLYQFSGGTAGEVQVAFIIDPGLEL